MEEKETKVTITVLDIIYLNHKMDNIRTSQETHDVSPTRPSA
jgi:hypothetical protein